MGLWLGQMGIVVWTDGNGVGGDRWELRLYDRWEFIVWTDGN